MFIDRLRQGAQSKLMIAIMWLVAMSFALFGLQNYLVSRANTQVVAKVGDVEITEARLNQETERLLNRVAMETKTRPNAAVAEELRKIALKHLSDKIALTTASENLGFFSDHKLVSRAILDDKTFHVNGQFNKTRYDQLLQRVGMREKDLFNTMSDLLLQQQLQGAIALTSFALPRELDHFARLASESRDIVIIQIPEKSDSTKFKPIEEEALKSYYTSHLNDYMTKEKVILSYLVLDRAKGEHALPVSQQEIEDYYQNHFSSTQSIKQLKSKIIKAVQREKAQSAFLSLTDQLTDLAYSEETSLSDTGKELGLSVQTSPWLEREGLKKGVFKNQAVIKAAFSDAVFKSGINSGVIPLNADKNASPKVMVLRVLKKQEAKPLAFDAVRPLIEKKIKAKKREEARVDRAHTLLEEIEKLKNSSALRDFVHKHGLKVSHLNHLKRTGASERSSEEIQNLAFNHMQVNKNHLSAHLLASDSGPQVLVLLARHDGALDSKQHRVSVGTNLHGQLAKAELVSFTRSLLNTPE